MRNNYKSGFIKISDHKIHFKKDYVVFLDN